MEQLNARDRENEIPGTPDSIVGPESTSSVPKESAWAGIQRVSMNALSSLKGTIANSGRAFVVGAAMLGVAGEVGGAEALTKASSVENTQKKSTGRMRPMKDAKGKLMRDANGKMRMEPMPPEAAEIIKAMELAKISPGPQCGLLCVFKKDGVYYIADLKNGDREATAEDLQRPAVFLEDYDTEADFLNRGIRFKVPPRRVLIDGINLEVRKGFPSEQSVAVSNTNDDINGVYLGQGDRRLFVLKKGELIPADEWNASGSKEQASNALPGGAINPSKPEGAKQVPVKPVVPNGGDAQAVIQHNPEKEHDRFVEKIDANKWRIRPQILEKNGEGTRSASEIPAEKFEYVPLVLDKELVIQPTGPEVTVHTNFPLPRDMFDAKLHDAVVNVQVENGTASDVKLTVSQPYNNQSLNIIVKGGGRNPIRIQIGVFARTTRGVTPAAKDKELISMLRADSKLASAIQTMLQTTKFVHENVTYDRNTVVSGQQALSGKKGDCGSMTSANLILDPNEAFVAGYSAALEGPGTSMHAWAQVGNVKGDPAFGHVQALQLGDIPAIVGQNGFVFDENGKVFNGQMLKAENGGLVVSYGGKIIDHSPIVLSVPGKGPRGAWLAQHAETPNDVKEEQNNFIKERQQVNAGQKLVQK